MQQTDSNQPNPWSSDLEESQIRLSLLHSTQRYRYSSRRKAAILQSYSYEELRGCCRTHRQRWLDNSIGQYRFPLDRFTWEVTRGGGRRDVSALNSAKRELREETGYVADHWLELFAASASPGTTKSIAPGFVAWGLHRGEPDPDPEELITQRRVPFSAAVAMSISGRLPISGVSPQYCRLKRGSGGANFLLTSRAS